VYTGLAMEQSERSKVLEELRTSAIAVYGEARTGEARMQEALESAATALWRVQREDLDPLELEPWRHG
jgi:RNase P/RNase MRP subunit POP5